MRTRIENIHILTMDHQFHEYHNSNITIDNDTIIAIDDCSLDVDQIIDGKNGILIPGMVNVHSHLSMIPFRSLGDDCPDRLRRFLFPLESKAMTKELAVASAKYAVCELMLGGVTQVFDMYFYEGDIAQVMEDMNMRATLAETILDFVAPNTDKPYGGLDYSEYYIPKWKNKSSLVKIINSFHITL